MKKLVFIILRINIGLKGSVLSFIYLNIYLNPGKLCPDNVGCGRLIDLL